MAQFFEENSHAYRIFYKDYLYSVGLPDELENEISNAVNKCYKYYKIAKENNDFSLVENDFYKLICLKREEIGIINVQGEDNYDKLMRYCCGDYFAEKLDFIMNTILKSITTQNIRYSEKTDFKMLSIEEMKLLYQNYGINLETIVFQEDINNSCLQLTQNDCRMTYQSHVKINAAKHEMGHILYMQNILKNEEYYVYNQPLSSVFDEAIALLYELIIDNESYFQNEQYTRTPIRIECTDILRLLHIIIRYEIERDIINDKIGVEEIKTRWNERFYELFGYEVTSDNEGILQDPHWFCGNFGYFPIYNVAFAVALIIYKILELNTANKNQILLKLKKHILSFGASKTEEEILLKLGVTDFCRDLENVFEELKNKHGGCFYTANLNNENELS